MAKTFNSVRQPKAFNASPFMFEALPGEIRNRVFEFCIQDALKWTKKSRYSIQRPPARGFELTIHPQWKGVLRVRVDTIGPLPLLFVSKQIYRDFVTLIYSKVEKLCIGGYILQYWNEDPNLRWQLMYSRLRNLPSLQKFTKNVKITLPSIRDDLERRYWASMGIKIAHRLPNSDAIMAVVPGLVKFLQTFNSLSSLEIWILVEKTDPPDFEPLLQLYDLCGEKTLVAFTSPSEYLSTTYLHTWSPTNAIWKDAWQDCLSRNGRG